MSRILNIARKDILLRFASPVELLFFLILPVIFSVIVSSFATSQGNGDNRTVVLVINQDGGVLSDDLVQTLESSASVRPEVLAADAAAKAFDDGDSPALLTIPAGFETALRASSDTKSGQPCMTLQTVRAVEGHASSCPRATRLHPIPPGADEAAPSTTIRIVSEHVYLFQRTR